MKSSTSDMDRGAQSSFPHFADKYKCCCGTVHVRQGAQMVGVVTAVFIIISLFFGLFAKEGATTTILEYIVLAAELITVALLFVGISKYKAPFLLPYIGFTVVSQVFTIVLIVLSCYTVFNPETTFGQYVRQYAETSENAELRKEISNKEDVDPHIMIRIVSVFLTTALAIAFVLNMWWLLVVYRCYRYLRDLQQHRERHTSVSFNVEAATIH